MRLPSQFVIFPAFLVLFVFEGCKEVEARKAPAPKVTVSKPLIRDTTDYLYFTGNTDATQTVELRARVSGTLTKVNFKDGDYVKAGDILFEIEPDQYQAKLEQAKAKVTAVQAAVLRATIEFNRQADLLIKKAAPASDVDKWRAQRDEATASLEEAKAAVTLAEIQYGYTHIEAPFDGRMDRRLKDVGNLVGASETTLLSTIRRLDPMYAYFNISEKDVAAVRAIAGKSDQNNEQQSNSKRASVELSAEGEEGYPHKGNLDFGSSSFDSQTGSLLLRASFDNPFTASRIPNLIPGMFVRLRMPIRTIPNAILVQEKDVGVSQEGRFIFVVNDQNLAEKRVVEAGPLQDGYRVILAGLNPEDKVVIEGVQRIRPGIKVEATLK